MTTTRLCLASALVALALGATACGDEVVAQDEVQDEVSRLVAQQLGDEPKSVDCPEDLKAEEGEKMRCTVAPAQGKEINVEVTVTSVDGDRANFSVEAVE